MANFSAALADFGTPTEDESRAALYNRACSYVKLRQYDEARDDLTLAVGPGRYCLRGPGRKPPASLYMRKRLSLFWQILPATKRARGQRTPPY